MEKKPSWKMSRKKLQAVQSFRRGLVRFWEVNLDFFAFFF